VRTNHEWAAAVVVGTAGSVVGPEGTAATEAEAEAAESTAGTDAVAVAVEEAEADNNCCNSILVELRTRSTHNPLCLRGGRMEVLLTVRQPHKAVWESSSSKGVIGP
jgi:hypothetical protein